MTYSKNELPYAHAVANAVLSNAEFRSFLLRGTPYADITYTPFPAEIRARLRSKTLKNPYWFNYFCGKDSNCTCKIEAGLETDILIILENAAHERLAWHFEIKCPDKSLEPGQAETYPRRAACWVNHATRSPRVPPHNAALTFLVGGRALQSDPRIKHFDRVLFYDEIEQFAPTSHLTPSDNPSHP